MTATETRKVVTLVHKEKIDRITVEELPDGQTMIRTFVGGVEYVKCVEKGGKGQVIDFLDGAGFIPVQKSTIC